MGGQGCFTVNAQFCFLQMLRKNSAIVACDSRVSAGLFIALARRAAAISQAVLAEHPQRWRSSPVARREDDAGSQHIATGHCAILSGGQPRRLTDPSAAHQSRALRSVSQYGWPTGWTFLAFYPHRHYQNRHYALLRFSIPTSAN
jgi:hypothetical protein